MSTFEPGIYEMSEADYFGADWAFSHSGAKLVLEAPAKYAHDRDAPPVDSGDAMNFGSATHCAVLNPHDVDELVAIGDFDSWRSKASQEFKDEAVAAGRAPVLVKDWAKALEMARRVHDHPVAMSLLEACALRERSLFWQADGIWKRARIDFMGGKHSSGKYLAGDYKTTRDASLKAFERSVLNYGYHSQQAHYDEGVIACTGERDTAFLFIVQETDAPYLVNVVELSSELALMGAERMQHAVRVFKECQASGVWRGYSDRIETAIAPTWATYEHEENRTKWGME